MLAGVKDRVTCDCEVLQGCGKRCVLRLGERGEPEAAADHEVRIAPELPLSSDHGAPDDLRGEAARSERRWEVKIAWSAKPEEAKMLDLCPCDAEVEQTNLSHAPHPSGGTLAQYHARHRTPLLRLRHGLSVTFAEGLYHGNAFLPTGIDGQFVLAQPNVLAYRPSAPRDRRVCSAPWSNVKASPMERCLIIVSRDQPELLAQLAFMYAHEPNVAVCFDRRQGQPWTGAGDYPDRRSLPRPDTDLHDHGFIVIPQP